MADKGKPFLIEYLSPEGALINKFKFVLNAHTVAELRDKIQDKLQAKNQIQQGESIVIKDIDDFELGSDDEVGDVIPDGRVRIYQKKAIVAQPTQPQVPQPSQQPSQQPTQPVTTSPQPSQQQVSSIHSLSAASKVAVDIPILDLTNWSIPAIPESCPKDKIMHIVCPQIRKAPIDFELESYDLTFNELSQTIIKRFKLQPELKALLYTSEGQPLLFNLDLFQTKLPKLDLQKTFNVIFTATKTVADKPQVAPLECTDNPIQLKVSKGTTNYTFSIDLNNTLSVLKYKIYTQTGIHTQSQIIKFAGNALTNDAEMLSTCGVKAESILELSFKVMSNLVPSSYSDKFFYKDVELLHPQDVQAYRFFKSNILALGIHLGEIEKLRMLSFVRYYTSNEPLVCALRTLFLNGFLSQAHRISLEEGLYTALWHYAKGCNPSPKTEVEFLFNHTRDLLGFFYEAISNPGHPDAAFQATEKTVLISQNCSLTNKPITHPSFIKLDSGETVIVDRNEMSEQIDKGYTFPLLKAPTKAQLFDNYSLLENFDIYRANTAVEGSQSTVSVCLWLGADQKPLDMKLPSVETIDKYEAVLENKNVNLKIHRALEIKNKSSVYLILTNKEGEYRIFISKNKDINNPHNVFDVITGKEEAVNLDLMMAAGKTENLEEVVDAADLKPVITREPKEAIVVLFDISGSMAGKFFNEPDLLRIGACKLFFQALAYRTIAYSFEHVVSLTFFDSNIEIQCDFTEAIYDFNRLVSAAKPRSTTRLYDSIISAVNQLVSFKKRYPECILRILALTDGEDVGSSHSIFDAAKAVITHDIVMDSFAVGTNCQGLKNISLATGGKCYLAGNMEESLKLFEQETVLSVRARKIEYMYQGKTDAEIRDCLEKVKMQPFDMANSVHAFKQPEIKGPGLSSKDMAKRYESETEQKKISGNKSLVRIAKEIQLYNENPHPFVSIYPCENINVWKILLLGPKETPYENGLFLLYASFPGDYPFKAPEVRFITPIYHCNMNQQGRICHSVFDRNYTPALKFRDIIDCVYGLILTPEPEDPLDNVIASYFLSDYQTYLQKAKEATAKNASKSSHEIVDQIFGRITDDIERQKKVEQVEKWIELAKSCN